MTGVKHPDSLRYLMTAEGLPQILEELSLLCLEREAEEEQQNGDIERAKAFVHASTALSRVAHILEEAGL